MSAVVIRGDEEYTPEEWARVERRRAWERAYQQRPEVRSRKLAYHRAWRERNREHVRAAKREQMRRWRAERAA